MGKSNALKVIEELGPMSAREVAEHMGISYSFGRAAVSYCKNLKQIYIHSYRRDEDGGRLYPRALYAAGNLPDAKKMKPLPVSAYRKRHTKKKQAIVNSVFGLATPVDHRRLTQRKRPDVTERHRKASETAT